MPNSAIAPLNTADRAVLANALGGGSILDVIASRGAVEAIDRCLQRLAAISVGLEPGAFAGEEVRLVLEEPSEGFGRRLEEQLEG